MSAAHYKRRAWCLFGGLLLALCNVAGAQAPQPAGDSAAALPARGTTTAFLELEVDDAAPYVQQSVGVVVRLYYASQLLSGELTLDAPEGASLQRVGQDRSQVTEINGRRYNLVERRYLLIPERSGPLLLRGPHFEGRSAGGFFDEMFGGGNGRLQARAPDRTLQVRPQPDAAAQPWLPLHDLRLRYVAAPSQGRAGEALTVVVEAVADGATRAQFPELPTPDPGADAQVFAEPAQYDELFNGSTPQLRLTRRYAIVPRQAGALVVPGLRMPWWNVRSGQAQTATLPDLTLSVAAGRPGSTPAPTALDTREALPGTPAAPSDGIVPVPVPVPLPAGVGVWQALAAGFALLWLLTLGWAWARRRRPPTSAVGTDGAVAPVADAPSRAQLRRALDSEGLDEIIALLAAMGGVTGLQGVLERLADPAQQQALLALQDARWSRAGGDVGQARQALRRAFHDGPHWRPSGTTENTGLAPLYPRR